MEGTAEYVLYTWSYVASRGFFLICEISLNSSKQLASVYITLVQGLQFVHMNMLWGNYCVGGEDVL